MLRTCLIAASLFLAVPAVVSAQDDAPAMSEAERIAREYMIHYSAVDLDGMESFLAEDVVFSDPTALGPNVGEDGYHHEGRDAVMSALNEFRQNSNPIELGFVWDTIFESNGRVVFIGEVNALYPTQTEGQIFRWRASQVTVITVRDGQIIRQDDFANYASPDRSLLLR